MLHRTLPTLACLLGAAVSYAAGPAPATAAGRSARPNTVITSAPRARTTSHRAVVRFHATRRHARFACALDGRRWRRCRSPRRLHGLALGRHRLRVRARTAAGRERTPAVAHWRVVRATGASDGPQPGGAGLPGPGPGPVPPPGPGPELLGASLPPRLPASTGRTFYVSTTGSDGNPGTLAAPWRTVQKAFDTLQPGQIALVRGGTYTQNLVMDRAGRPSAPITVANYPGERPVLHPDPSGSLPYPLRLTTGAAYVRIQGFVIENAQGHSTMNVVGLGHNPGAHDYEIAGCEIRFAKNSSGVFIDNTNANVWLLANRVHDNNEPGVQHQGIYDEADHSVIADNVVYHQTDGFGIQVRTDLHAGPNHVVVANNTVSDVSLSGIMIEHTVSNATIVNNVSAFNAGTGIRGYFSDGDHPNDPVGTGNVARHNLVYGNDRDVYSDPTPSGDTILRFEDNTVADPRFADRAADDFRPLAGSPAIDAALPDFAPPFDVLLAPRPRGAGPDLGAYETG